METYRGGCHCGRVVYRVEGNPESATILDCNCSLCAKKAILHWIVDEAQFELVRGEEALRMYQFNTRTAEHYFCETCGVQSFYRPRSHPEGVSVNARCLEGVDLKTLEIEAFDGENWQAAVDEIRE